VDNYPAGERPSTRSGYVPDESIATNPRVSAGGPASAVSTSIHQVLRYTAGDAAEDSEVRCMQNGSQISRGIPEELKPGSSLQALAGIYT